MHVIVDRRSGVWLRFELISICAQCFDLPINLALEKCSDECGDVQGWGVHGIDEAD